MRRSRWESLEEEERARRRAAEVREARAKEAARASFARSKRQRTAASSSSPQSSGSASARAPVPPRSAYPPISGCRSVSRFERLNHIEEGSYGVVFRARDRETGEVVALKQLKLDKEKGGFPITSLREIHTLLEARHPHIVELKELVVGDTLNQYVVPQCVFANLRIYLVMEFVEHDLKTLLGTMRTPFLQSEVKTLMQQLLSAVALMHSRWIVHRDLKTSNLLIDNRGRIKLADFGLARLFGDPLEEMTGLVVTLWYRAPELLLGAQLYDTAVDMWSVGCIFGELLLKEPLLPGKGEADQLSRIYHLLGAPSEAVWPGFSRLPNARSAAGSTAPLAEPDAGPAEGLRHRFRYCTEGALDLLHRLLTYDPAQRITAEEALEHPYFFESPPPAHPDSFGSFPSVAAGDKRRFATPDAPKAQAQPKTSYQLDFGLDA